MSTPTPTSIVTPKPPTYPSQVVVIITIVGVDESAQVFYTYTDERGATVNLQDPRSDVYAIVPYHTIYVLDYASSRNGWQIEELIPVSPPLPWNNFSYPKQGKYLTLATTHSDGQTYVFSLKFYNQVSNKSKRDDPQEANIKQPTY